MRSLKADNPVLAGEWSKKNGSLKPDEQFEIVGIFNHGSDNVFDLAKPVVNGRELYSRVAVRIRTPECKSNKRRDKAVTRELL